MLDEILLARMLEEALKKGGDWAEVYTEEKQVSSLFVEDERIERMNQGREIGVGIRVISGENTAYVYTNKLKQKDLLAASRLAARGAGAAKRQHRIVSLMKLPGLKRPDEERVVQALEPGDKIQLVLAANQAARQVGADIKQVSISAADLYKKVQIANSDGGLVEDEYSRARVAINAVAARDGIIQTGFQSAGGTCGWEILQEVSFEDLAGQAARLAVSMLDARPAPAGRMPVVMAAQAGGTMVHEACGHGLEADLVQKGLSVYQHDMNREVAAPGVSVIDDPTLEAKYGSYRFDDEGRRSHKTVLIDQGRLVDFLFDRLTALREARSDSCNGRRESYQHKPIPRMSNTFIAPGADDPEEIIRSTEHGLLVKKMGGGQVNTTNGDFVFEVQEGYVIEDGQVAYPVRGATLTGNGPQVLKSIDRIGKDLGFGIGVCGKDGQGVPVADAQPTIRIKELTIGGTGSAEKRKKSMRRI
ncbi:MAG TPA: TldD/PmbA family protein [Syntrophomonadaceae bacterium]|nr:TldD/PmbA family protein [Syntrophomonadaceae bacterium]